MHHIKRKQRAKIMLAGLIMLAVSANNASAWPWSKKEIASIELKFGHVGHDHHLALFVAADNSAKFAAKTGVYLKPIKDKKFYELYDGKRKLADITLVKVGGGSKMPTALAQGVIEVGFGGTAAVLAAVDKGAPIKLISPLHSKGDMFVLAPDFSANSWKDFVEQAKQSQKPIRIGYKNPIAVAKVIFEEALKHEGLTFSGDMSKADVDVHMINVKGGGKLNVSLSAGIIDGYVGNNPFPAIGAEKKMLKIVADLEDLPPGNFKNHPCCCIGAQTKAMTEKGEAIEALLILLIQATELINNDLDAAIDSATKWIGTSRSVESNSIPTSGYSMQVSAAWHTHMQVWLDSMSGLGIFSGKLKGLDEKGVAEMAYDLSLLKKAND